MPALEIPGLDSFTGAGVYYGAASIEAHACHSEIIYIVGRGNSACQAAMYMSKFTKEVNIITRRDTLSQVAANYLVENIGRTPNITVLSNTEVTDCSGSAILESITLRNSNTGEEQIVPAKALFVYIGARPGTAWLNDIVLKDEKGFIICGSDLLKVKSFSPAWN